MFYTEHARMRITERNFSIDMIEDAMNLFSLHGKWDQKNERVTLHTNSICGPWAGCTIHSRANCCS